MKKYLITSLLLITLIPSIAFASWWNPLSWFNNWKFNKTEKIQEKLPEEQKTQEEKINELQKQIEELKNNKETQEQKSKEESKTKIEKTNKTTEQKDVCSNIEGIQIITPEGYSNNLGTCEPLKDFCPNIEGVQSVFPAGYILDRKTEKCLTEEEQDQINKYKAEEERILKNNQLVEEYEDKINEIDKKILELQKKYLKDQEEIPQLSAGSKYQTEATISEITKTYNNNIQKLELQKKDLYFQYKDKIDNL